MSVIVEQFDSISKLIKALSERENCPIMATARDSESTDDNSWSGTDSYEEAVEFATKGYTKPLDALKRGTIEAERKANAPRRCKVVNDIVGYVPNVPAAVIGLPQSMVRSDNEPKKSKVVSIIYAPTMNCDTSAREIEKAGVAVLSIINNLEKNGYRVSLEVLFKFSGEGYEKTVATVKVKDWRQPIDLKKVAFPLCNAAMQRRIGFRWLETCDRITDRGWRRGYGRSFTNYSEAKGVLESANLISEKEFFVNVEICKRNGFDPNKIAAACGIAKAR